jgi:hypothetical protein
MPARFFEGTLSRAFALFVLTPHADKGKREDRSDHHSLINNSNLDQEPNLRRQSISLTLLISFRSKLEPFYKSSESSLENLISLPEK